jgi:predicted nucleotidyltransferase
MDTTELITLLKGEKEFFESQSDIAEIILYGSALSEEEITEDIDLLIAPSREMLPGELVDLRQLIWEHLKDQLPVALDVQAVRDDLNKETLSLSGAEIELIFAR